MLVCGSTAASTIRCGVCARAWVEMIASLPVMLFVTSCGFPPYMEPGTDA